MRVIGVMSGTSYDAVELAAADPRGALNLGGIANVTVGSNGELLAWHIGPANALVDATVARLSGGAEPMPSVLDALTPGDEPLRLPTPATARPTRLVVDGR